MRKIDRQACVRAHNPCLETIIHESPLSLGNGHFAFTADVTGLQTLYDDYASADVPLCTMAEWAWHTVPAPTASAAYTYNDLDMTEFDYDGRTVRQAVDRTARTAHVYEWLRTNPHHYNLARIGFVLDGQPVEAGSISRISQRLDLYTGILDSSWELDGFPVSVRTAVMHDADVLGLSITSPLLAGDRLGVRVSFPYGSQGISGSDWTAPGKHRSTVLKNDGRQVVWSRVMDAEETHVVLSSPSGLRCSRSAEHDFHIRFQSGEQADMTFSFSPGLDLGFRECSAVLDASRAWWAGFWEKGGIADFSRCTDPRAPELERRIILSLYLQAVHCSGDFAPQETGLFCNSWYGKSHLEMYPWHCLSPLLWGRPYLVERSMDWYRTHLGVARTNALRNGFRGARWPKMIAPDGVDSPSPIATLLVWQQPHIVHMLETRYRAEKDSSLLEEYWDVVRDTADYMVDTVVKNPATGRYDIVPPVIPVQEKFNPRMVYNPAFEVEYWAEVLTIAAEWARRLGFPVPQEWEAVAADMADIPHDDRYYLAHDACPDTFEAFHKDHPSMLGALGYLPGRRVDPAMMQKTLDKVLEVWDFPTMWGWDFALMAMTATRLGKPAQAVDLILSPQVKNTYVASGQNYQTGRPDLPVYLPGNGGLLLAVALMLAGYDGCGSGTPGFPHDGTWDVAWEDIHPSL